MKKSNQPIPEDYAGLLAEVKERVRAAQYEALKAVNKELVTLYWDIGRMVTERQAAGAHGTAVVKRLAADLQVEFPGMAGFSWRKLFYMSEFFTAYRDKPKLHPLVAIITRAGRDFQVFGGWGMNRRLPQGQRPIFQPQGPL